MNLRLDRKIDAWLIGRFPSLWALALPVVLVGLLPWLVVLSTWHRVPEASEIQLVIYSFYALFGYGALVSVAWLLLVASRLTRLPIGFDTLAVPTVGVGVVLAFSSPAFVHGVHASDQLARRYDGQMDLVLWATERSHRTKNDNTMSEGLEIRGQFPVSLDEVVSRCVEDTLERWHGGRTLATAKCVWRTRPLVIQWLIHGSHQPQVPNSKESKEIIDSLIPEISYLQRAFGTGRVDRVRDRRLDTAHEAVILQQSVVVAMCFGPWLLAVASVTSRREALIGLLIAASLGTAGLTLLADAQAQSRAVPALGSLAIIYAAGILWPLLRTRFPRGALGSLAMAVHLVALPWVAHLWELSNNWGLSYELFRELVIVGIVCALLELSLLLWFLRRYRAEPPHPMRSWAALLGRIRRVPDWLRSTTKPTSPSKAPTPLSWLVQGKRGAIVAVGLAGASCFVAAFAPMSLAAVPDTELWFVWSASITSVGASWWLGAAIRRRGALGWTTDGAATLALVSIPLGVLVATPFAVAEITEYRTATMYAAVDGALQARSNAIHSAVALETWGEPGANANGAIIDSGELERALELSYLDSWGLLDESDEQDVKRWYSSTTRLRTTHRGDPHGAWQGERHVRAIADQTLPRAFECVTELDDQKLLRLDPSRSADCGFSLTPFRTRVANPFDDEWQDELLGNLRRVLEAGCDGSDECRALANTRASYTQHQHRTQGLAGMLIVAGAALSMLAAALALSPSAIAASVASGLLAAALYLEGLPWWGLGISSLLAFILAALCLQHRRPALTAATLSLWCGATVASLALACVAVHRLLGDLGQSGFVATSISVAVAISIGCVRASLTRSAHMRFVGRPLWSSSRKPASP